jgi:phage terminase small subunit
MKDDLTEKQRALVDTIVATGCSITEAAKTAGYSTAISKDSARVSASRTLRLPKVQQYMQQRIAQTLGLGAVSASKRLIELSTGARSEYVQLEASRDILDRVGLRTPDKVSHNIQGDIKINIDLT